MKNKKIVIAIAAIVIACCAMFGIYRMTRPAVQEGSKAVTLEVVDDTGASKVYESKTDAEYLSEYMDELAAEGDFSYEGSTSEYGLFIETVNGVTADYNTDGAYWAIYVNDEYGQYGADSQPVADGDAFKLAYEK